MTTTEESFTAWLNTRPPIPTSTPFAADAVAQTFLDTAHEPNAYWYALDCLWVVVAASDLDVWLCNLPHAVQNMADKLVSMNMLRKLSAHVYTARMM